MSHHHERIVCRCGRVIMQCRCMEPKTDRVAPGPCTHAPMTTRGPAEGTPGGQMSDDNGHGPPHIESAEEARLKLTIESFKRGAAARDAVLATLQAENAELRGRLGTAERDLAKPENWPIEALNETNALFDRARAAEGERDRLRELLACYTGSNRARDTFDFQAEARAALAAIPHAEGEASAPPKETT